MPTISSQLVEVCVFRFAENRSEYLLLRRASGDVLYPGIWQVVTGTVQQGESAIEAALRELKEETDLLPVRLWVVPYSSSFYDHTTDTINISPFFAVQVNPGMSPKLSDEHESCQWMPYTEARRHLVWPSQRIGLDMVEEFILSGEQAGKVTAVPLPC
jgi:dATP pyrophosphohydrolase